VTPLESAMAVLIAVILPIWEGMLRDQRAVNALPAGVRVRPR
jgi:hypothetical protein